MPGIAGIIGPLNNHLRTEMIAAMVNSMTHERTFKTGKLVDPYAEIAAGWVCHPGSFADCMPVWNETHDICLILSGELLPEGGNGFRSSAGSYNASSTLSLYEKHGASFVARLNGTFGGLVIDLREGRAFLFNDRYGCGRIYWVQKDGVLYFASEAKALLKALPELKSLDERGLGEWLACGCVLQNRTLFSRIEILPPASLWTCLLRMGGSIHQAKYFNPAEWEAQPVLEMARFREEFLRTFSEANARCFQGAHKLALSLTGGLDSRMILASAPRAPYRLPCYTFNGMYRDCSDVRIAREVAKVAQQEHEVISVTKKVFADFPALAKRSVLFSDGTMDVTGAIELFVNKAAREIAPVRVTGNYGDEILRGHVAFRPRLFKEALTPPMVDHVRRAFETYESERRCSTLSFILFKQLPWHHYARASVEQAQLTTRTPYLDNRLTKLMYQAPPEASSTDFALSVIAAGNPFIARIPTDRGFSWNANSAVSKFRQIRQMFTIRAEYASDYGMPASAVRLSQLAPALEWDRLFLGRHKFYHFKRWYRQELSRYVQDVLLDPRARTRSHLDDSSIESLVTGHIKGTRNATTEIHKLLSLELLCRSLSS